MGRAIMLQGTASHVGKSVLTAGLCRLFLQEGLRVAPFKAQNMALNSFATPDGFEIGRAQAVQAEAAGVAPTVDMNPILLKPEGNAVSQVVVHGRVVGVMSAAEYHRTKPALWPLVEASLRRLLETYDLVVIEGAGSPVEVNLKAQDLVNMRVATAVQAPVLLIGDIDRGGVFASLVGTMELLEAEERALVAGFIINKFRGDPELFREGIGFLEERLERPVVGLVPWIPRLGIAEEDSLGIPDARESAPVGESGQIDVAVIRFLHLANFDDLDPLRAHPAFHVRFVEHPEQFGQPSLVILPGTKTTRADLQALHTSGLASCITEHARRGGEIVGICGGYQMLGMRIVDVEGAEGPPGQLAGLGLLPVETWFAREKATRQVTGQVVAPRGWLANAMHAAISGYEIHMGRSTHQEAAAFSVRASSGEAWTDGIVSADGRIVGTYLHGFFHNPAVVQALAHHWQRSDALPNPQNASRFDPYNQLALVLRQSLRMDCLLPLVGLS